MNGWIRIGVIAAVGLAGCRHTCADRVRKPDCDPCAAGPRFAAAPAGLCRDVVSAASAGPRQTMIGSPTSVSTLPGGYFPGVFGPPTVSGPFAPVVPPMSPPNELPLPEETIPAPQLPIAAGPTVPGAIAPVVLPR